MLSLFPELLFLSLFAPLLFRIALAVYFVLAARTHMQKGLTVLSTVEILVAVPLLIGAWTQIVALAALALCAYALYTPRTRTYPVSTLALMALISFSLLITGAGAFAFDLPL